MQPFICDPLRALAKFGIAMAAKRPIIATTIIISTSVKPAFLEGLIFIPLLTFQSQRRCEQSSRRVMYKYRIVHSLPAATANLKAAQSMPIARLRFLAFVLLTASLWPLDR